MSRVQETSAASVFISYASEDRAAARTLRDALAAAGLEVWYDENELGGGDAWDQKIRRQIRECDYFMPMISATTERRKEGYFRREWRLAAERTMDMADDVMFLLPVTIDGTSDIGARVPDKFLTVQWLRLPGGQPTPALEALCRRLMTGDHHVAPPPLLRPGKAERPPAGKTRAEPLPLPPFPHIPEKGGVWHGIRLIADVFLWTLNAGWMLLQRLPRWVRLVLAIWMLFLIVPRINRFFSPSDSARREKPSSEEAAKVKKAMKDTATQVAAGLDPQKFADGDFGKVGEALGRSIAAVFDAKPLTVFPFESAVTDEADREIVHAIFTACFGKLAVARGNDVGLSPEAAANLTDKTLQARGKALRSDFVLHARVGTGAEAHTLVVRMLRVTDATVAWTGTYPLAGSAPATVAGQIAEGVLATLPPR